MKQTSCRTASKIAAAGLMVASFGALFSPSAAAQAQASFVYVANNNPSLSIYGVDADTGALIDMGIASIGPSSSAFCLSVIPSQAFMYVCDNSGGGTWGFFVDAGSGALTPLPGSPFPIYSLSLAADPTGRFLVIAEASGPGVVSSHRIDQEVGDLYVVSRVIGGTPWSVAFDPTGQYVYAANVNSDTVSGFRFNPQTGELTPVPGSPFTAGRNPFRVAVDPSGQFLYVPNVNGSNLSAYRIDPGTGALSTIAGSPYPTGPVPEAIVIDPSGTYLYVANINRNIDGFSIDPDTGALASLEGCSPCAAQHSEPLDLAADPSGQFLYAGNHDAREMTVLTLDSATGRLRVSSTTPSPGAPLAIALIRP